MLKLYRLRFDEEYSSLEIYARAENADAARAEMIAFLSDKRNETGIVIEAYIPDARSLPVVEVQEQVWLAGHSE